MDFDLTEELKMLKDMAYKFAVAEFTPLSKECDEHEKYTPEIRRKAAENGLVGAWIPEEYGGAGAGILGNCIITEELSKVDMGIGLNVVAATFGCESIFQYGSEEQKKTYLPPVCRGEWVSAGSFTEPNAGTDVAGYKTRAVKDGSDYVINGNKMFITNGTVCDFMVTQCITNPEEKKHNSFSLIIIPADAKGVTRNKIRGKLGIRSSDTAEIALEDVDAFLQHDARHGGRSGAGPVGGLPGDEHQICQGADGLRGAAGLVPADSEEAYGDGHHDRSLAGPGLQVRLAHRCGPARLSPGRDGEILQRTGGGFLRQQRRGSSRRLWVYRRILCPEVVPRRQDPRTL